jgi:membrane protein implicated in regulation of membrane protease activity
MSAVTATFLGIGCFSLVVLALSLVGGHGHLHLGHFHLGHLHLGHFHLGHLHLGHLRVGHVRASHGEGAGLSFPALSAFVGAFGFGGAIVASVVPVHGGGAVALASVAGLLAGVPTAWAAGRLVESAMNMSTDATPTSADLVGATGVVISEVPVGSYGQVRLFVAGQPMKFNARSAEPLALGTHVLVVDVSSPTSVVVEPTPQIFVQKEG